MDVEFAVEILVDAQRHRAGANERERGLRRLFHHVAQLPRQLNAALVPLQQADLDGHDVAAELGVDQAGRRRDLVLLLHHAVVIAALAEIVFQIVGVDASHARHAPPATLRATLRQSVAISRSRLRTPASRVYSRISLRSASSVIVRCSAVRP